MRREYDLHGILALLFVFSIENINDAVREKIIVSKDVNDDEGLGQLFDLLICPELLFYSPKGHDLLIGALDHFLVSGDSFDRVFSKLDTYLMRMLRISAGLCESC